MEDNEVWRSRQSDSLDLKPDPPPQESLFSNFPFFKEDYSVISCLDQQPPPPHQVERSGNFLNSTDQYMREFLTNEPSLRESRYSADRPKAHSPSLAPTPFPGTQNSRNVRRHKSEPLYPAPNSRRVANKPTPFPSYNHSLSAPTTYNQYSEQFACRDRNEVPGRPPAFPPRPGPPHAKGFPNRPSSSGGRDQPPPPPPHLPPHTHYPLISRSPLSEMDRQVKKLFTDAKHLHKKKKRKHANYFVALQITNPSIKKKINAIQTALKNRSSKLVDNMIPIETLHLVIGTLNLPCESDLWRAVEGFKAFGEKKLHDLLPHKTSCRLNIQGVENFKNRVLYATMPDGDPRIRLKRIHLALRAHFQEIGLEGEYHKKFEPHLIICKTDGTITDELLDCLNDFSLNFGFQFIHRLDFCAKSMTDFRYNVMTSISPKRSFAFV